MNHYIKLFEDWEPEEDWEESNPEDQISSGLINGLDSEGRKVGYWEEFYTSGKLKRTGVYKFGKEEGNWTEFWDNGNKKESCNYINGKRHGISKSYRYSDGYNTFDQEWKNGILINET